MPRFHTNNNKYKVSRAYEYNSLLQSEVELYFKIEIAA